MDFNNKYLNVIVNYNFSLGPLGHIFLSEKTEGRFIKAYRELRSKSPTAKNLTPDYNKTRGKSQNEKKSRLFYTIDRTIQLAITGRYILTCHAKCPVRPCK